MNLQLQKLRNVGISAHIDSGKTTLTERMLFYGGRIHKMRDIRGNDGGPTMDSGKIEQRRGITITSAVTRIDWDQHAINVIDTPGHVDFTVEVERSLRVLDGAVLVLCSVGGVQSQSLTVDRQMWRYGVPRIAFINKMDRVGANPQRVIEQMKSRLRTNAVALQLPIGSESDFVGVVDLIAMSSVYFEGKYGEKIRRESIAENMLDSAMAARQQMLESIANVDESFLEIFLNDSQPDVDSIRAAIRRATLAHQMTPVLMGTAYKNKGVQEVLDGINFYLPSPTDRVISANRLSPAKEKENETSNEQLEKVELVHNNDLPLVAMGFKTVEQKFGQLTFVRIYQGQLEKGKVVTNMRTGKRTRISRLMRLHANQQEEISVAHAGDIVGVVGANSASGDTFTDGKLNVAMENIFVPEPVMRLSIMPANQNRAEAMSRALDRFRRDDPTFQVQSDSETGETLIAGMGQLHLEVYLERLKEDHDCECLVGRPSVAYKERPSRAVDFTHRLKKQSGGPGQFAQIVARLEPLPEDSDETFVFEDQTVGGRIDRKFVPSIRKGFAETLKNGPMGQFEVFGTKITLLDGEMHEKDSSEYAFQLCAQQALRDVVLPQANVKLWEPIMKMEIEFPSQFQGAITGNIAKIRGLVTGTETNDGNSTLFAEVPLAELFDYSNTIRSLTQGNASFSMELLGYRETTQREQESIVGFASKVG